MGWQGRTIFDYLRERCLAGVPLDETEYPLMSVDGCLPPPPPFLQYGPLETNPTIWPPKETMAAIMDDSPNPTADNGKSASIDIIQTVGASPLELDKNDLSHLSEEEIAVLNSIAMNSLEEEADDDTVIVAGTDLDTPQDPPLQTMVELGNKVPEWDKQTYMLKGRRLTAQNELDSLYDRTYLLECYTCMCAMIPRLLLGQYKNAIKYEMELEGGQDGKMIFNGITVRKQTAKTILRMLRDEFTQQVKDLDGVVFPTATKKKENKK